MAYNWSSYCLSFNYFRTVWRLFFFHINGLRCAHRELWWQVRTLSTFAPPNSVACRYILLLHLYSGCNCTLGSLVRILILAFRAYKFCSDRVSTDVSWPACENFTKFHCKYMAPLWSVLLLDHHVFILLHNIHPVQVSCFVVTPKITENHDWT